MRVLIKCRMGRDELMRISKALALFRPSVLASMMNLTEDDLIFTEKCLQRTLLVCITIEGKKIMYTKPIFIRNTKN